MNRMLVVVFKTEKKAFEGREALRSLDRDGSISAYAYAVIKKTPDGVSVVKEGDDPGPLGTLVGTSLGSLIGLLGGPVGLAVGASVGLLGGMVADLDNARIGDDFVDEVSRKLTPGTFALVAEIEEEWTTPVDTRMEAIGGEVSRRALSDVRHAANTEEVAAMKADLTQMKAEHAQAKADRKAKLHEKINQLEAKIQQHQEKAKVRREAAEARAQAKVAILKAKTDALRKVASGS
ncbi:MAG TPA: DUF1269 domain-containing protein [Fimbriimonadaceae bacterium]|nr:DUF1269 domain-containing protein [Fimbriimonadaceae bacterium]